MRVSTKTIPYIQESLPDHEENKVGQAFQQKKYWQIQKERKSKEIKSYRCQNLSKKVATEKEQVVSKDQHRVGRAYPAASLPEVIDLPQKRKEFILLSSRFRVFQG